VKCDHCPVSQGLRCPGEDAPVLCRNALERPGYGAVLQSHAEQMAGKGYPSLLTQAKNAALAAVRAVASGFAAVDQAEQERRLAICRACAHYDPDRQRCRKCGCLARWKARLQSEHCPLDPPKW
jgi:hypothetical protein